MRLTITKPVTMKRRRTRYIVLATGLALFVSGVTPLVRHALAAENGPAVTLKSEGAQPRAVEDSTEKAIVRDYAASWRAIENGLGNNDVNALDAGLVGFARDQFAAVIDTQGKTGVKVRYTDQGHQVEALFYSADGSAMQLRDTAKLTREVLDGDKVLSHDELTAHYVVIMAVTEDHWKLRSLEEVPAF